MNRETTRRVLHNLRSNWPRVLAVLWALWLTYTVQSTRNNIDSVAGQVSALEDKIDAQDMSHEMQKIQNSLTDIERRIPY